MSKSTTKRVGEPNIAKMSLVTEILSSAGNLDRESIDDQVSVLEQTIARARAEIARTIEKQYMEFLPDVVVDARALNIKINAVRASSEEQLNKIKNFVDVTPTTIDNQASDIVKRLRAVDDSIARIALISDIADTFQEMDALPCDEVPLQYAKCIINVKTKLQTLIAAQESGSDEHMFDERIMPPLSEELVSHREQLILKMTEWWNEFITIETHPEEHIMTLTFWPNELSIVSEKLSALQLLNEFDRNFSKLTKFVLKNLCEPLIIATDGDGDRLTFTSRTVVSANRRQYRLRLTSKHDDTMKRPDAKDVFWSLTRLFDNLNADLALIEVNNVGIMQIIGRKIGESLRAMIVDEVLTPAIPYDEPTNNARFDDIMNAANVFHARMQEIKLFGDDSQTFEKFAENYETLFIDRRCQKIINDGRMLITQPLHNLVKVGSEENADEETVDDFNRTFDQVISKLKQNDTSSTSEQPVLLNDDNKLPKLKRFPMCQVSDTIIQLTDMIMTTLDGVVKSSVPKSAARLLETTRNLVELYIIITPLHHQQMISTVPQVAAVFYNNCYYLAHRLMTISFDLSPTISTAIGIKEYRATFVQFVPRLRQLASDCMEKQLVQRRREISSTLADETVFENLKDDGRLQQCEKVCNACTLQIEQVARVWREVLTSSVLLKSLGNLTTHLLSTIVKIIIAKEDITSSDADLIAQILERMLKNVEKQLIYNGESEIYRYSQLSYFRMKELIGCLGGSLQEISDRWCEGNGPLAQWMSASDVKQLIRALFQNTQRRANILARIN